MTDYEKLKRKYKITIWVLVIGILLLIFSISIDNAKLMSILGSISLVLVIIDFFIFKHYQKTLKQAKTIKIGTEQAIKDGNKK